MGIRGRSDEQIRQAIRSKVEVEASGCWIWQGRFDRKLPAMRSRRHNTQLAHRLAYLVFCCEPPEGHWITRSCGV